MSEIFAAPVYVCVYVCLFVTVELPVCLLAVFLINGIVSDYFCSLSVWLISCLLYVLVWLCCVFSW